MFPLCISIFVIQYLGYSSIFLHFRDWVHGETVFLGILLLVVERAEAVGWEKLMEMPFSESVTTVKTRVCLPLASPAELASVMSQGKTSAAKG